MWSWVTGGVITSAGVAQASTFAALGVIPILLPAQIAFIVTYGVLLDTVIVPSQPTGGRGRSALLGRVSGGGFGGRSVSL